LVIVHRQLLRKFTTIQFDVVEEKKKVQLRDDRIKQLETTQKQSQQSSRQTAERHLQELSYLREQIQVNTK
jgi:kinesin family protein 5